MTMTSIRRLYPSIFSMTTTTFLALLSITTTTTTTTTTAFPTGAGTCLAGDRAPVGHEGFLKVEDSGNYVFTLDGMEVSRDDDDDNDTTTTVHYVPGMDHVLRLEGINGSMFKGFLLRASSSSNNNDEEDLSGCLSNPTNNADVQILLSTGEAQGSIDDPGRCAEFVAGACHTGDINGMATPKSFVEVTFTPPGSNAVKFELTIMVTAVLYHYSSYTLTIEGDTSLSSSSTTTTEAPVDSPTNDEETNSDEESDDSSATTIFTAISSTMSWALASMAVGSFLLLF